jgi:nitroreductase
VVQVTGSTGKTTIKEMIATVLSQNIMLALTALGLGSCYMGGLVLGCRVFKYKPLLRALDLPKGHAVHQALVLGTPTVQLKRMPERKRRKIRFR